MTAPYFAPFHDPAAGAPSDAPTVRPRRLRRGLILRRAVAETTVRVRDLMQPAFVLPGRGVRVPIEAMPGVERLSVDALLPAVEKSLRLGIDKVLLFGVPPQIDKDGHGSHAADDEGLVPSAVRALKAQFGHDLLVATDVCLCAYTEHGHCGVLHGDEVDNDASLPHLANMALAHARAGADVVAPSDMMDGRVRALRRALDADGRTHTALLSYSVKYASAYYGPFREAADCAPQRGDRRGYQMDPANVREALREAALDEAEGADMLMVKPALAFLDVLRAVRQQSQLPLAAYNVSGEYAMVKAAAQQKLIDEAGVVRENLLGMRRAGAELIITYHADDAARGRWLDG